jgi:hypothetical protein
MRTHELADCLSRIVSLSTFEYYPNVSICELVGLNVPFKKDIGMSAQEVKSVFPEIVCTAPCDIDTDMNSGEPRSRTGMDLLTVRYERLVPIIIQSLKELTERVSYVEHVVHNICSFSIPRGVVALRTCPIVLGSLIGNLYRTISRIFQLL